MTRVKNLFSILVIFLVIVFVGFNYKKISKTVQEKFARPKIVIKEGNEYTKGKDYKFVQQSKDFIPHNYQDILNIYYSFLDRGWDEFTFYCDEEYKDCVKDIETISNDNVLLSNINNYVHPFNSYSEIRTIYDEAGEITIKASHQYTKDDITQINYKVDELFNNNVNDTMGPFTKLRTLHDYIINNTTYDINRVNKNDETYDSTRMNGILMQGYGICSAYADLMATILFRLDIDNIKISSIKHVWNGVYFNNSWLHLDATWDDPVTSDGSQFLSHDFYLITTEQLMKKAEENNETEHLFDNKYYLYF